MTINVCDFCQDFIGNDYIRPCGCNRMYHPRCINHLVNLDEKPLGLAECNKCSSIYQYDYKSHIHRKLHNLYSQIAVGYMWIYSVICGLSILIVGLRGGSSYIISGLTNSNVIFALVSWILILASYLYLRLTPIKEVLFLVTLCILLLVIITNTPDGWLDWTWIALSSGAIAQTKKYWFVLSSEYPYTQVIDSSPVIQLEDI